MRGTGSEPDAPRTARAWLAALDLELPDPTDEDLRDLDVAMGYDEFWEWSSGKVDLVNWRKSSWKETIVVWLVVWGVLLLVVWLHQLL